MTRRKGAEKGGRIPARGAELRGLRALEGSVSRQGRRRKQRRRRDRERNLEYRYTFPVQSFTSPIYFFSHPHLIIDNLVLHLSISILTPWSAFGPVRKRQRKDRGVFLLYRDYFEKLAHRHRRVNERPVPVPTQISKPTSLRIAYRYIWHVIGHLGGTHLRIQYQEGKAAAEKQQTGGSSNPAWETIPRLRWTVGRNPRGR